MPTWVPRTEEDLRLAASGGSLVEGHRLDLKAAVSAGSTANRDLAIDMASLAVDGGLILIGVDERTTPPSLTPITLRGQKERIDQVALSRVDQSLNVSVVELSASAGAGQGYLAILVPPSPAAPHMVDNIYRGRSDTTNTRLSDAEVRRIREQRSQGERSVLPLIHAEKERDPVPGEDSWQAHMFVVAQPEYAVARMLQAQVTSLSDFVTRAAANARPLRQNWDPDLRHMRAFPRSAGWALTNLSQDRRVRGPADDRLLDIEIHEDGGIRLFASVSDWQGEAGTGYRVVSDVRLHGLILRSVQLAGTVAAEANYLGNWRVAVQMANMGGVMSRFALSDYETTAPAFDANEYLETTVVTAAELSRDPVAVVDRLTGRLNRALTHGAFSYPAPV